MTTMLALVGEQPIPNLLPVRYLNPQALLLVYTSLTEPVAKRLGQLAGGTEVLYCKVDPYDIGRIRDSLAHAVGGRSDLLFNLTGGTKPMMLAAYDLAAESGSPFVYLQTEGQRHAERQSKLYTYHFVQGRAQLESTPILPALVTIDDYLRAHLPGYRETGFSRDEGGQINEGGRFEQAIQRALAPAVDEIKAGVRPEGVADQIEIDLVVRCGNQLGIVEAKMGASKAGIDQLSTAGGARYLGTYTARFLVVGRRLYSQHKTLAQARNVIVIEMPGYTDGRALGRDEADRLRRTIRTGLGAVT